MSDFQHITGKNGQAFVSGIPFAFDKITASISDGMEVVKTRGVPDGYSEGDVGCDGEVEMKYKYFKQFSILAKAAGSYRAIPAMDISYIGATKSDVVPIVLYGCKFTMESILEAEANDGKKSGMVKLKFAVTSPDFVSINGVPYLDELETLGVLG
jgi:hypothetical protein